MKTKLTLILTAIWAVLAGLNESGLIDALPIANEQIKDWVKWIVAVGVVIANTFFTDPKEAKTFIKSIGGGGIKPPKK